MLEAAGCWRGDRDSDVALMRVRALDQIQPRHETVSLGVHMKQHMAIVAFASLPIAGACATNDTQADPIDTAVAYAANCDAAQGPVQSFATDSELTQLLLGQWIRCSGPALFDNEQLGFELGSDGTYHLLGDDGAGGAEALDGFDVQGTWNVFEGLLVFQMTSDVSESGGVTLETGPRKFDAQFGYSGMDSIYAIAQ
jgi:hypothetical protein